MFRRAKTLAALAAAALISASAVTGAPAASATPAGNANPADPNYIWKNDPASKFLAGKPFADKVLHRVPGSLHDAPRIPAEATKAQARGNALYGPGTPILVGKAPTDLVCTVAVAGFNDKGEKVALTAGHCAKNVGDPVVNADARALGVTGTVTEINRELDYALITLAPKTEVTRTYDGLTINHLGSAPILPGNRVCKKGVASGVTCGPTWYDYNVMNINQVCAMQGDSGAPLYVGDRLVGLVNGGMFPHPFALACHTPLQGPIHAPTGSARADAVVPRIAGGLRLP